MFLKRYKGGIFASNGRKEMHVDVKLKGMIKDISLLSSFLNRCLFTQFVFLFGRIAIPRLSLTSLIRKSYEKLANLIKVIVWPRLVDVK